MAATGPGWWCRRTFGPTSLAESLEPLGLVLGRQDAEDLLDEVPHRLQAGRLEVEDLDRVRLERIDQGDKAIKRDLG